MDAETEETQWIAWFDAGELPSQLARRDSNVVGLAGLHNHGRLDLLSLVEDGHLQALGDLDFFAATDAVNGLLPDIEAGAERLMAVVEAMAERGGTDLSAGQPYRALVAWFARRPAQARQVVARAEQGDPLSMRHVRLALEALGDAVGAREIAERTRGMCRLGALTALSWIADDAIGYAASLALIGQLVCEEDEQAVAIERQAFVTTANIYDRAKPEVRAAAEATLRHLLDRYGQSLPVAIAHVLFTQPALLEASVLPALLEGASAVDPKLFGVVQQLDEVARRLVVSGSVDAASALVRRLLVRGQGTLTGRSFRGFSHAVLSRPPPELGQLVVRWLADGEPAVCDALHEMLGDGDLEGRPLTIDIAAMPASYEDMLFLCGKAAGWLMFVPVSATSVLCAGIRASQGTQREELGQLMVDLLLENYRCACQYVEMLLDADPAWSCLQPFLDIAMRYKDASQAIPVIPELAPSDERRRIQHLKYADEMREVNKAAGEQSFFASLFKPSLILHGSAMVMMVRDAAGNSRRLDAPLTSFSVSKEIPRQVEIDPIGFELKVRMLKFGARPS